MATIEKLEIQITANTEKAIKSIGKLKDYMKELKTASSKSGLESTYRVLEKISKLNFSNLAPLQKLTQGNMSKAKREIAALQSELSKVKQQLESTNAPRSDGTVSQFNRIKSAASSLGDKMDSSTNPAVRRLKAGVDRLKTAFSGLGKKSEESGEKMEKSTKKGDKGLKNMFKSFKQLLTIVVVYGGAFQLAMLAQRGVADGLKNIAKYSTETAENMNKLSTEALYIKNSFGAVLYPILVAITPTLMKMTDALVFALNGVNQFIGAFRGDTTFIKAKRVMKEYGDEAKKTAKKIQQSFAGIDEITTIGVKDSGSGEDTPDPSEMFETVEISRATTEAVEMIKNNLTNILIVMGSAIAAIGVILCFTGHLPMGIAMIIAGMSMVIAPVVVDWTTTELTLKQKLMYLMAIVSGALLVIGVLLCFTGHPAVGVAMILVGAAGLVTAVTINWDEMPQKVKDTLGKIMAAVGVALLAIGIILCFTPAIPTGIGLIIAGVASIAGAVAINWDDLPNKIRTFFSDMLTLVGQSLMVVGFILCCVGFIANGIPMLIAGAVSYGMGQALPDATSFKDFIRRTINEIIGLIESGLNSIINKINSIVIDVPDWMQKITDITSWSPSIPTVNIPRLATGGFPDGEDGLFYANHNELVGEFSNGRTAVANNAQIVEGIKQGVYEAMLNVLSDTNSGSDKPTTIMIDGTKVGEAVVKYHNNFVKTTGYSPLKVGG